MKEQTYSHDPRLLTRTNMANHVTTIRTKKREILNEFAITFALVIGAILLAGAVSEARNWYLDAQKQNRASLDATYGTSYEARAGER